MLQLAAMKHKGVNKAEWRRVVSSERQTSDLTVKYFFYMLL